MNKDSKEMQVVIQFQNDMTERVTSFAEVWDSVYFRRFKSWGLMNYVDASVYQGVLRATNNSLNASAKKLEMSPCKLRAMHAAYLGNIKYSDELDKPIVWNYQHICAGNNEVFLINEKEGKYYDGS